MATLDEILPKMGALCQCYHFLLAVPRNTFPKLNYGKSEKMSKVEIRLRDHYTHKDILPHGFQSTKKVFVRYFTLLHKNDFGTICCHIAPKLK
jgi:hypothetical protein